MIQKFVFAALLTVSSVVMADDHTAAAPAAPVAADSAGHMDPAHAAAGAAHQAAAGDSAHHKKGPAHHGKGHGHHGKPHGKGGKGAHHDAAAHGAGTHHDAAAPVAPAPEAAPAH